MDQNIYAMPDKKALSVAKCLVKFMARYGRVDKLHSDLGMEFQASVSKHLYELWGVHKTFTTPYTPWSDGQVEHANSMCGMSTSGASCKRTIVQCKSALDTPHSCLCTHGVRILICRLIYYIPVVGPT